MAAHPEPVLLYPEIAERGSLAASLQALAGEAGLSIRFIASDADPLRHAFAETALEHRSGLHVSAYAVERRWAIRGESFQGRALIDGDTRDLTQIVRAAQAWCDGTALDGIRQAAPFVHLTGRIEVPNNDPVRLAESEWRFLLKEAQELEYAWAPQYRALIEAAYGEPVLRALYPFTSHWELRFSTSTRPQLTVVPVSLAAGEDGRYTVSAPRMGNVVAETTSVREAVSAAVRELRNLGILTRVSTWRRWSS
jgi:hypothetical protein